MPKLIKGAILDKNILSKDGYVLFSEADAKSKNVHFYLKNLNQSCYSFVFGFRGAGNHFRLDYSSDLRRYVLTRVLDGIPVYLQHAYVEHGQENEVEIAWNNHSIRLFSQGVCFVNILTDGLDDGDWGFKAIGEPSVVPDIRIENNSIKNYQWIVVGDGYHNNRWKNRDFYAWPELAFGDKLNYLNACVAAGNTMRVLKVVEQISSFISGASLIVAAGSDDLIEGHSLDSIKCRLAAIDSRLRELGAKHVYISTLPAKPMLGDKCAKLNEWIINNFSNSPDKPLDFYEVLARIPDKGLVRNDHPTPEAHREIADFILERFSMERHTALLGIKSDSIQRGRLTKIRDRFMSKALYRLNKMLKTIE